MTPQEIAFSTTWYFKSALQIFLVNFDEEFKTNDIEKHLEEWKWMRSLDAVIYDATSIESIYLK